MWKYKYKEFAEKEDLISFLNEHQECDSASITISPHQHTYTLWYRELDFSNEIKPGTMTDENHKERNYTLGVANVVYEMQDPGDTLQTYESPVPAPTY